MLEVLRQPLEDRRVNISRARATYSFPSQFMLIAAMNPCPCGYLGAESEQQPCTCSPLKIIQYRSKISGPLLDRIDLHIEVPKPAFAQLSHHSDNLSSEKMLEQVLMAKQRQLSRYQGTGIQTNSELSGKLLRRICRLTPEGSRLMEASFESLGLSARAHDRILRLALTVADMDQSEQIMPQHVAEAIQYRNLDKKQSM
ncbi:ATP-binding protein [Paenibacillus hexagrammi]|uniref:ATP-binding protein n=1 Tax=Paenibacillus hexagrammi TaxID=2908839 RepID=UPI002882EAF2|nr:ATP-binding protein [Paenibacillus sp. YPD9-1]